MAARCLAVLADVGGDEFGDGFGVFAVGEVAETLEDHAGVGTGEGFGLAVCGCEQGAGIGVALEVEGR